jgi:hypothetical protein
MRLLLSGLILVGCGSDASVRRPANHDDFRAIQRSEAELEVARVAALRPDAGCRQTCSGVATTCGASADICEVAYRVRDHDAAERCERADRSCGDVRARAARCACDGHDR